MVRKRPHSPAASSSETKKVKVEVPDSSWIRVSKVAAYIIKDPILDWFDTQATHHRISHPRDPLLELLFQRGKEFESAIITVLRERFPNQIRQIASGPADSHDPEKVVATIQAINDRIPFIYQGVLWDHDRKIVGMPDLLVRGDYINQLTQVAPLTRSEARSDRYWVIEIKYSQLHLASDGDHLLNSGRQPAYKGQLHLYNQMLEKIQGSLSPRTFVLGKGWNYTCRNETFRGNGWFDTLGIVEYSSKIDRDIPDRTESALSWLRELHEHGQEWSIGSRPELFPNMSNTSDAPWHSQKVKVAEEIKELTGLWYVGVRHRESALAAGVDNWGDPQCTAQFLGIKNQRGDILDAIISINQQEEELIRPPKFTEEISQEFRKVPGEFFVDFETVNTLIEAPTANHPYSSDINFIFLIGCGWMEDGKWCYRDFCARSLTSEGEQEVLQDFHAWMACKIKEMKVDHPTIYHWGAAEETCYTKAFERASMQQRARYHPEKWINLLELFHAVPIVLKDCLGFGLKGIATTMKKHCFIEEDWGDDPMGGSGVLAVMGPLAQDLIRHPRPLEQCPEVRRIIKYNEADCRTVCAIMSHLRTRFTLKEGDTTPQEDASKPQTPPYSSS